MSEGSRAALIHVNAFGPHSLKILGVCAENLIRVDDVTESPNLVA
jgi:hypothetical protein